MMASNPIAATTCTIATTYPDSTIRLAMFHLRTCAALAKRAPALSPGLGSPPRERSRLCWRARVSEGRRLATSAQRIEQDYLSRDCAHSINAGQRMPTATRQVAGA